MVLRDKIPEEGAEVPSPWGTFLIRGHAAGLTRLDFPGDFKAPWKPASESLHEAAERLKRYFEGGQRDFYDLTFDLSQKSPFAQKVLKHLAASGPRECLTYTELARRAGVCRAARAVGNVMRENDLPIFIACHRVLASGGRFGGYSKGLVWKRRFLELEGISVCF